MDNDSSRPNIVLILVDDMGFSDIGCYGSEIQTPNLDRLGRRGVRFTQMYNCARCCPSRASLLTGLYPHQVGIGHMVGNDNLPGYMGYLTDNCVTIAETLRLGGYRTMMSGKWHVGGAYSPRSPETWRLGADGYPIPIQRGFDEHFGTVAGGGSYFKPPTLMRNDRLIKPEGEVFHYTDAISDESCHMIERGSKDNRPFFLYVAYTAPHWPLHALPQDIAKYEGKYRDGWDALRTARHEQLNSLGILDPKWGISARDEKAPPWDDLDAKRRDWEDLRMAVYAAQIDQMDQGVGTICDKLRELGIEDNTVVMFLSDNGGCAEFLAEDTNAPQPHRYNIPTRDGRPVRVGNIPELRPGGDDTFMSYDLPWANASNSPFRLYKHWVHEGGIATPLIVHFPGKLSEGAIVHTPAHVIDILPTLLEIAGVDYPDSYEENAITPVEGVSFASALRGDKWDPERILFWEHEGNRAVRQDNWKLVSKYPGDWELYDMSADRTELNDLSEKDPEKVKELEQEYEQWAPRCNVVPWDELKAYKKSKRS